MSQSRGKVLVTPRSLSAKGHPALDPLTSAGYEVVYAAPGRQRTEQELLAVLPDCVGYLAGVERVSATVLKAATKLRAILACPHALDRSRGSIRWNRLHG